MLLHYLCGEGRINIKKMDNTIFTRNGLSPWRAVIIKETDITAVNKAIALFLSQNYPGHRLLSKLPSLRIAEANERIRAFRSESIKDIEGIKRLVYFDVSPFHKNRIKKKRRLLGRPAGLPLEDVEACRDKKLDAALFKNYSRCPQCKRPPEKLTWIEFTSPPWTWPAKCGKQGPLSWCPNCSIQVEFILKRLS